MWAGPVVGVSGCKSVRSAWRGLVSAFGLTVATPGGILGTGLSGCTTTGGGFSDSVSGDGRIGAAAEGSLWLDCCPIFSSMTSFEPSALVFVALALGGICCCCDFTLAGWEAVAGVFGGWVDSLEPSSWFSSEPPQQLRNERNPPRFLGLGSEPACARPAEPGLAFSPSPVTWRFERLLPVLASLRRPVRLLFELVSTLSDVPFAVAPLRPVAEPSCPGTPSDGCPAEVAVDGSDNVFAVGACDWDGSAVGRLG
jgi:hypothetical protein